MEYKEYHTSGGERWDTLAAWAYGDAMKFNTIRNANNDIPSYDVLPAGLVVKIPILEQTTNNTDVSRLPVWKQ